MSNTRKLAWYVVGGSVVGVIGALGALNITIQLLSLLGYVVTLIALAFWLRSQPLDEEPLERFIIGSAVFGFIQIYVLAYVGDSYEFPLLDGFSGVNAISGLIIFLTATVAGFIAGEIVKPSFLG
jgi:hypothetical protein